MVVGDTLLNIAGNAYYSPTFARGGLAAVFTCEVLQLSSAATLDVTVEHKNLEDTSFSTLGTFTQFVTPIVKTTTVAGIKEQVRFKYEVGGSNAYDAVCVKMADPAWRPY